MTTAPDLTPRQQEILTTAAELFRREGLSGLTVRRLAGEMGFSEAALYRHFASKEELLVALMGAMSKRRLGPLRGLAEDRSRTPVERLEAMLDLWLTNLLELEGVPLLFLAEALIGGDEALVAQARAVAGGLFTVFTDALENAPLPPGSPPAEHLTPILMGYATAVALRLRLGDGVLGEGPLDGERVHRVGRYLVRLLTGTVADDGGEET